MTSPRSFEVLALRASKAVLAVVFGVLAELSGWRILWVPAAISLLQVAVTRDYPTLNKWRGEVIFKIVLVVALLLIPAVKAKAYAATSPTARVLWAATLGCLLAEFLLLISGRVRRVWAFTRTES